MVGGSGKGEEPSVQWGLGSRCLAYIDLGESNGEQVRAVGCACSGLHHGVYRGGFQAVPALGYHVLQSSGLS